MGNSSQGASQPSLGLEQFARHSAPRPEDFEVPSRMPAGNADTYRAVFFDLDGTLLPMDLEDFLGTYMKRLAAFAVGRGADPEAFSQGFKAGLGAMMGNDGPLTNREAFWKLFYEVMPDSDIDWEALTSEFYEEKFGAIGKNVVPNPAAAHIVNTLVEKEYPLVLATMPMFPLPAVLWRLKWAGVSSKAFARITSYDRATSIKPHASFFAENLAACGLEGKDVLMVGNNTVEDLAISKLGAETYIVTDCLLNPAKLDLATVPHGTLAELADWVDGLAPCAHPAPSINPGL